MFLDDKLYNLCKGAIIISDEDVQTLNKDLCTMCEKYYKENIHQNMTNKEVGAVLDRTFNLFDSFDERQTLHFLCPSQ